MFEIKNISVAVLRKIELLCKVPQLIRERIFSSVVDHFRFSLIQLQWLAAMGQITSNSKGQDLLRWITFARRCWASHFRFSLIQLQWLAAMGQITSNSKGQDLLRWITFARRCWASHFRFSLI